MNWENRMWRLSRPSEAEIDGFIASQRNVGFSYSPVGASYAGAPGGFDVIDHRVALGRGPIVYEQACLALRGWRMFPASWTEVHPEGAMIRRGTTVAIVVHVYGVWWLNACRIVYLVDKTLPCRRFGFAYGTLPAHVEIGEELFLVEWDSENTVWYAVRSFSRPHYWMARMGYPVTRRLQRRFLLESQSAMLHFVRNHLPTSSAVEADPPASIV